MSILDEAVEIIDNSWCKGDLKREGEARDAGDAYCAMGALAHTTAAPLGLVVDWEAEQIGPKENFNFDKDEYGEVIGFHDAVTWALAPGVRPLYEFMDEKPETQALADVILEKYPERLVEEGPVDELTLSQIVYLFNDNDATTREEVIEVFKEAAKHA